MRKRFSKSLPISFWNSSRAKEINEQTKDEVKLKVGILELNLGSTVKKSVELVCNITFDWQKHKTKVVKNPPFVWNEKYYFKLTPNDVSNVIVIKVYSYKSFKASFLGEAQIVITEELLTQGKMPTIWYPVSSKSNKTVGEICVQLEIPSKEMEIEAKFEERRSLVLASPLPQIKTETNVASPQNISSSLLINDKTKGDGDSSKEEVSEDEFGSHVRLWGAEDETPERRNLTSKQITGYSSAFETVEAPFPTESENFFVTDNYLGDWNKRFQNITQQMRNFNYETDNTEKLRVYRDLIHLSQDFLYNAKVYGKIIIAERELPVFEKTIPPITDTLPGHAGGDKYKKHNILFKFAVDNYRLYGCNDAAVAKAAGHDLKGLHCFFDCDLKDVCLPLMALIDHRGYRLIAMSLILTIDKERTLVVNSADGGKTMHNKSPELMEKLRIGGEMLNLKPHYAGLNNQILTYTAADVEGHLDIDNKFYLLDFARVLPPEAPFLNLDFLVDRDQCLSGFRKALTYRLRKEFVKSYPVPLCSDAFSTFIRGEDVQIHNSEVIEATKFLYDRHIPSVAAELPQLLYQMSGRGFVDNGVACINSCFRLTETIHSRGVNVRHLGRVLNAFRFTTIPFMTTRSPRIPISYRSMESICYCSAGANPLEIACPRCMAECFGEERCTEASILTDTKHLLLLEMFARVIKSLLRRKLREQMGQLKKPMEEPHRRLVIDFFNIVFGNLPESSAFFEDNLKTEVLEKFEGCDLMHEIQELSSIRAGQINSPTITLKECILGFDRIFTHRINGKLMLLLRLQKMTGLKFTHVAQKQFFTTRKLYQSHPFGALDIEELGERVKHMNVVAHAEGWQLMTQGLQLRATDSKSAIALLKLAVEKFEEGLDTCSHSIVTLRDTAHALVYLYFELEQRNHVQSTSSDSGHKLSSSGSSQPHSPRASVIPQSGSGLFTSLLDRANHYYNMALALAPHDLITLLDYSKFLEKCGRLVEAEDHYLKLLELDPNFVAGLLGYAHFLEYYKKQWDEAERFLLRVAECRERKVNKYTELVRGTDTNNHFINGSY